MKLRQKKRIKDTAHMVKNVIDMRNNMDILIKEYEDDLNSFFAKLFPPQDKQSSEEGHNHNSDIDINSIILYNDHSLDNTEDSTEHSKTESNSEPQKRAKPTKTKRPPNRIIKDLYRMIMKKCHPDRTASEDNLNDAEKIIYAYSLSLAIEAYKKSDIAMLVFSAALVDIYSSKINSNRCLKYLNDLYSENSEKINLVQGCVPWSWGTSWDDFELRFKIIVQVCNHKNIPVPSKDRILEVLTKHELEEE